jgi:uncharacterized protein
MKVLYVFVSFMFIGGYFPLAGEAQRVEFPDRPTGYVNDFVGLLTEQDRNTIASLAAELDQKSSVQLAIVTVETTIPETIEEYALRLFEKWGIGQEGKDNGVLLLVAYADRAVRIEVGYDLEGVLTDAISKRIIDREIIPYFKAGNFSQGVVRGSTGIVGLVAASYGISIQAPIKESIPHSALADSKISLEKNIGALLILIYLLAFIWLYFWTCYRSYRGYGYWWRGGYSGGGFSTGGFRGGGFGGFGGGRSGGGGASGRW